ncbi:MAG: hypothetical protein M1838_002109 [Thelocarpon superellum]|nr:MAG: hypothetical protein M1838_002109 [Thelocarpon superellum]
MLAPGVGHVAIFAGLLALATAHHHAAHHHVARRPVARSLEADQAQYNIQCLQGDTSPPLSLGGVTHSSCVTAVQNVVKAMAGDNWSMDRTSVGNLLQLDAGSAYAQNEKGDPSQSATCLATFTANSNLSHVTYIYPYDLFLGFSTQLTKCQAPHGTKFGKSQATDIKNAFGTWKVTGGFAQNDIPPSLSSQPLAKLQVDPAEYQATCNKVNRDATDGTVQEGNATYGYVNNGSSPAGPATFAACYQAVTNVMLNMTSGDWDPTGTGSQGGLADLTHAHWAETEEARPPPQDIPAAPQTSLHGTCLATFTISNLDQNGIDYTDIYGGFLIALLQCGKPGDTFGRGESDEDGRHWKIIGNFTTADIPFGVRTPLNSSS